MPQKRFILLAIIALSVLTMGSSVVWADYYCDENSECVNIDGGGTGCHLHSSEQTCFTFPNGCSSGYVRGCP